MSEEADLAVVNDLTGETPHLIEAAFGMGSPYHQSFGVYADGIALAEVALPDGWEGRLQSQQVADQDEPDNPVTLLFPEVHDLCASKLIVAVTGGFGRRSDREFVTALADAGHLDLDCSTAASTSSPSPTSFAPELATSSTDSADRSRGSGTM